MSNKVRAKVVCCTVNATNENGEPVELNSPETKTEMVTFAAVMDGSEENKSFSQYTPSLNLTMSMTAEGAIGAFRQGQEYYLDFTAVGATANAGTETKEEPEHLDAE